MQHFVAFQALFVLEAFVANVTLERLLFLVCRILMFFELLRGEEFAIAMGTGVTRLFSVYFLVTLQLSQPRKLLLTNRARIRLFFRMCTHMFAQIVFGKKVSVAFGAFVIAIAMSALNMQH